MPELPEFSIKNSGRGRQKAQGKRQKATANEGVHERPGKRR